METGYPLLFLALGTLAGVWFLAAGARKQVANSKGAPERSSVIQAPRGRAAAEHGRHGALSRALPRGPCER